MKQARKRVSLSTIAGGAESALRDMLIEQPKAWIREARERMRDLPKANFDLGLRFAREGKWFDAVFRFRVTLMLKPGYPRADYNLGCCYLQMGKHAEAKAALLKARALTPGNTDVIFMLATIDPSALAPGQRPTRMPLELVTGYYSDVADGYDIAEANLNYQAGPIMFELAKPFLASATPVVLDLGCGSGIAARPWRAMAASIRGMDITPAMLALAERATHVDKKLYDALVVADIGDLHKVDAPGTVDVVLLVNVVQFIGDLAPLLHGIAQMLTPKGIALVTTEPYATSGEFGLNVKTSRFGHAPEYVKNQAATAGLALLKEATVELYAGTPAQAFIFGKGNH